MVTKRTNCGPTRFGAPCVGSWVNYGLGTENKDLPGFVVMYDPRSSPEGGANLWDSGFLPGNNQGVTFRGSDKPILYLKRPAELTGKKQLAQLKLMRALNQQHLLKHPNDGSELQARIQSLETAYRMQTSASNIVDVSRESQHTQNLYGMDDPENRVFGTQLLMARRMVAVWPDCIALPLQTAIGQSEFLIRKGRRELCDILASNSINAHQRIRDGLVPLSWRWPLSCRF
jgi:hypothetical protein